MSDQSLASETLQLARVRVGTVLRQKWLLEKLLGVGGMAAVYAAVHRTNGSRVAIKILHPSLSLSEQHRKRFVAEGRAANLVDHPGVIRVLDDDIGEDGGVFQVMELIDGVSLDILGRKRGEEGRPELVVPLVTQMLDALHAAHAAGIVHRDVKPQNVLVSRQGQVKVLDFGIAHLHEGLLDAEHATRTGMVMGTPAFMPPEQAMGRWKLVDAQSDVWAVGATLFWLLSGRVVHLGDNAQQTLIYAATAPATKLADVAPGLDPRLCQIVDRALSFHKAERWANAAEMRDALRDWTTMSEASTYGISDTLPLSKRTAPASTTPDESARAITVSLPNTTIPWAPGSGVPMPTHLVRPGERRLADSLGPSQGPASTDLPRTGPTRSALALSWKLAAFGAGAALMTGATGALVLRGGGATANGAAPDAAVSAVNEAASPAPSAPASVVSAVPTPPVPSVAPAPPPPLPASTATPKNTPALRPSPGPGPKPAAPTQKPPKPDALQRFD